MKARNYFVIGMATFALTACGGGGGSDSNNNDSNQASAKPFNQNHLAQINDVGARTMGVDGHGAFIAVLDTGIDGTHDGFGSRLKVGADELADDGDRTYQGTALTDEVGHGTSVGSVAAGKNVGVAPGASVTSYKLLNTRTSGSSANAIGGFQAAKDANKAYVINLSFTAPFEATVSPDAPSSKIRKIVHEGIIKNDWVIVAAAGNGGGNADLGVSSADESIFDGHLLVVGAVDRNNKHADFSASAATNGETSGDYGKTRGVIEHFMVAPGVNVCAAVPASGGQSTCSGGGSNTPSKSYTGKSGTSLATPLVSGAVAVIRGAYPSLNGKQIVNILLDSAKDLGAPGYDSTYGAGLLDVGAALSLAAKRSKKQ